MPANGLCRFGQATGQSGTLGRAGVVFSAVLMLACAGAPGPRVESPSITRRPRIELTEGMTRSQVEDRVGPLLLREVIGDNHVYVEPQTRCYYIFIRELLRDWSC